MKKITEESSHYQDLEHMSVRELLFNINKEDAKVAEAVKLQISAIETVVENIVSRMKEGGRLFYIGAGTSGRLGILDASECPPTFGVSPDLVVGLIAGGDSAIRTAVEHAEDDPRGAWKDLQEYSVNKKDFIIGIAASGTTPYVIGGLEDARKRGIATACITCNIDSPLEKEADYPIVIPVGPEFVTGSTRMKAGTAQKMCLNMISTSVMIQLGRVEGNKMVDMQLTNDKLQNRAVRMLMEDLDIDSSQAFKLLVRHASVRKVKQMYVQSLKEEE